MVAAGADSEPGRERAAECQPLHCHADLARRDIDGVGQAVGANLARMTTQELGDQIVLRIHRRTVRMASRTVSSGPEMRSRAPSSKAVVSRTQSRRAHQDSMVSFRAWRRAPYRRTRNCSSPELPREVENLFPGRVRAADRGSSKESASAFFRNFRGWRRGRRVERRTVFAQSVRRASIRSRRTTHRRPT